MKAKVKAALKEAARRRRVVRLRRDGLEGKGAYTQGFVVGVTDQLVLVNIVDPAIVLDGFQALRVGDVTAVDAFDSAGFVEQALRLRKQQPRFPRGVRLDSVRALIESAAPRFPLITLHREHRERNACWIGRLAAIDDRRVTIDYITPSAAWDGQEEYTLRALTRIDFGGRYEEALAAVSARPARAAKSTRATRASG